MPGLQPNVSPYTLRDNYSHLHFPAKAVTEPYHRHMREANQMRRDFGVPKCLLLTPLTPSFSSWASQQKLHKHEPLKKLYNFTASSLAFKLGSQLPQRPARHAFSEKPLGWKPGDHAERDSENTKLKASQKHGRNPGTFSPRPWFLPISEVQKPRRRSSANGNPSRAIYFTYNPISSLNFARGSIFVWWTRGLEYGLWDAGCSDVFFLVFGLLLIQPVFGRLMLCLLQGCDGELKWSSLWVICLTMEWWSWGGFAARHSPAQAPSVDLQDMSFPLASDLKIAVLRGISLGGYGRRT